ncbi:MAG: hypothetical protein PHI16_05070 [Methanocellales archaeon]|nr:hypothetical protein [Methanocellales archaeon]
MTAKLALINKQDTCEIVRDQIAAIIAIEMANQFELATAAAEDDEDIIPADWSASIYIERSHPIPIDYLPAINVSFDNDRFDNKNSNMIDRQRATGIFYIDCYAKKDTTDAMSGDELTSRDADRLARLARNIIMSQEYTYLALGYRELGTGKNLVTRRYIPKREKLRPDMKQEGYENVVVCRLTLEVEYDELSPQVVMNDLELLIFSCKRESSAQIYFTAEYDLTEGD